MRAVFLFVAGILVGLAVQAAIAQNQNRGVVALNHVGISVQNVDEAVAYYTKVAGFSEAFRRLDDKGQPRLVYVQISKDTFLEIQPANADRPPGISHFGVEVQNMEAARAMFKQRGANVLDTRSSDTKAILSDIIDSKGIRMELLELPPGSAHRQAMEHPK